MKTLTSEHWLYGLVQAIRSHHRGEVGLLTVNKDDPLLHTYTAETSWCTDFEDYEKVFAIRPKYYKLFDEITDRNNYLGADGNPPKKGICAIVIGTPGTGKSAFLNYCLIRLLKDPENVVIFDIQEDNVSFRIDSKKIEEKSWDVESVPWRKERKTNQKVWALFDPANADDKKLVRAPYFRGYGNVILASSPNKDRFYQLADKKRSCKFYVYAWTLEEMQAFAHATHRGMDSGSIQRLFDITGGAVRAFEKSVDKHLATLLERLNNTSSEVLTQVDPHSSDPKNKMELTHKLLHYMEPDGFDPQNDKKPFQSVAFDFASKEARRRFLIEKAQTYNTNHLVQFLERVFRGSGSAAGILYEKAFPVIDRDAPFKLHRFDPYEEGKEVEWNVAKLDLSEVKDQWNVEDPLTRVAEAVAHREQHAYINPNRQNYPQIDAFLVEGNVLTFFQMTVAPSHSFNPTEIKAQVEAIQKKLTQAQQQDNNIDTSFEWRFVFVVLAKHIDKFKAELTKDASPNKKYFKGKTFLVSYM